MRSPGTTSAITITAPKADADSMRRGGKLTLDADTVRLRDG